MKLYKKMSVSMLVLMFIGIILPGITYAKSNDYVLENENRIPIPQTYIFEDVISNLQGIANEAGTLNGAEDMFINKQGYLFIADTGNNRVIKMTKNGMIVGIFKGAPNKPLKAPKGVFADDAGNMYIADAGNNRIVHLSSNGNFIEEFLNPESALLGEDYKFSPEKVCINNTGYIYVLGGQSVMTIDAYSRFRGYMGQSNIGYNFLDVLLRKFASKEQKRAVIKRNAAAYTNLTLSNDGFLYTTTLDMVEGEIKKLNSIGQNIYKKYSSGNFTFGERVNDKGESIKSHFADVAVDNNGIVTVVESNTCKLYQYDQEGNLLTVFGGKGNQKGSFNFPSSIVVDSDGKIYVLDKVLNSIQVFKPTRFIQLVHEAVMLYSEGEYDNAYIAWNEVLKIDVNYQLAHSGMAKVLFKQKEWGMSIKEYMQVEDKIGYSISFVKYRHDLFRENFVYVILSIIFGALVLYIIIKILMKMAESSIKKFRESSPDRMRTANVIKLSIAILFHPLDVMGIIKKNRDKFNYIPSIIILALVVIVRVFYIFTVHFPLADIDTRNANIFIETIRMLLPILTWVIASFAITTIMNGETKLNEIFLVSTFCMIPYIIMNTILPLLSNILSSNEAGLYNVISQLTWIWILTLFFISVKNLNDYKITKTAGICTISVVTILLIWCVSLLGFVLVGQLYGFIIGILQEFQMSLL